jgi:CPA2 family monovalent cation:H+ antiporter-2
MDIHGMQVLAPIIRDLAVILTTAGVVALLFQKIRQPVVLGYLIAGMIVGPFTPPQALISDAPNIQIIAELGVIFLMFSLGLEFSFHKLTKVGFSATVTGIAEVILMLMIGFATGKLLGWSYFDSIFLGSALAISSTTIIIKALEELNLKRKHFTDVVFGILIVEDLLAILLLVGLSALISSQNVLSLAMVGAMVKLITVVTAWFIVGYFLVPNLFRKIIVFANAETLTIVSIALCLILVVIAAHFKYSTALGAFIMGSILAETPQSERIIELIKPIRDIFAAVFFVSVGMLINPAMIIEHWPVVILLSIITIVGKILTSGVTAFLTGQKINNALRIGFSMAQIGEFSFIIVSLGTVMGVISGELYAIIVAVSAITTFTTPYLIRLSDYLSKQFTSRVSEKTKRKLDRYSESIYHFFASSEQGKTRRYAVIRFLINAMLVAIIFTLDDYLLLPEVQQFVNLPVKVIQWLSWLFAFILASPFMWAMMFYPSIYQADKKRFGVSIYSVIAYVLTLGELILINLIHFNNWKMIVIMVFCVSLYFIVFFGPLKRCYCWFEKELVSNVGVK